MPEPATLTAASFSPLSMFMNADWVVKGVLVGLVLASLWSWAVILDKFFRLGALNRTADRFEADVGSGRPLEEIAQDVGENPSHALPRMLQAALREWRGSRVRAALSETQTALTIQRIDRALDSVIAKESRRVEEGLGLLAIVATSSPFNRPCSAPSGAS